MDRDNRSMLEREREQFEEEIEMQLISNEFNVNKPSYMPYRNAGKRMINTLLISALLLGVFTFGGWYYTKTQYSSLSIENIDKMKVAVQYSVDSYYQDHKRFPVDSHGNLDLNHLKNKGYLNLNIEEYKGIFILDNQRRVSLKTGS